MTTYEVDPDNPTPKDGDRVRVAGTLDRVGLIDGVPTITDLKTGDLFSLSFRYEDEVGREWDGRAFR